MAKEQEFLWYWNLFVIPFPTASRRFLFSLWVVPKPFSLCIISVLGCAEILLFIRSSEEGFPCTQMANVNKILLPFGPRACLFAQQTQNWLLIPHSFAFIFEFDFLVTRNLFIIGLSLSANSSSTFSGWAVSKRDLFVCDAMYTGPSAWWESMPCRLNWSVYDRMNRVIRRKLSSADPLGQISMQSKETIDFFFFFNFCFCYCCFWAPNIKGRQWIQFHSLRTVKCEPNTNIPLKIRFTKSFFLRYQRTPNDHLPLKLLYRSAFIENPSKVYILWKPKSWRFQQYIYLKMKS